MPSKKHYIITSITLGAIAMASAVLIGVTNLATRNQIKKNEQNKINAGISEIFGKSATISKEFAIKEYKYSNYVYQVKQEEKDNNYALRTTGSNMYGKVSLIVGFKYQETEYVFSGLYVVSNEQTYASTLVENYIDPLNKNPKDPERLDDVSCGATYGAKLVRDMVNEAKEAVNKGFGE